VGRCASPSWVARERNSSTGPSPSIARPVTLPDWEITMSSAIPVRYPVRTGRESRLARNPRRATQPTRHTMPTAAASTAATSACRPGPAAPASAPTAAAVMSAVVDSGPTES